MWNEEQLSVIESSASIKQVIAAAGSGKTSTMIGLLSSQERKAEFHPTRTLIVTFTNKATDEFAVRIQKNRLSDKYRISTFHAFCYQLIKNHHPFYRSQAMRIVEKKELESFSIDFLFKYRFEIGGTPFPILFQRQAYLFRNQHPEIFAEYIAAWKKWKDVHRVLEFDELPEIVLGGLEKKENWTKTFKSEIDSIIVDEFQDTDFTQLKILQLLSPPNMTIVGDDWQAIYGFRGATPEPFLNFPNYFRNTKQFFLSTNYRSVKGIIDLSTHALKKNKSKISKTILAHRQGKTKFTKIILNNPKSDRVLHITDINRELSNPNDSIMLVRSNFRKKEWIQSGVDPRKIMTIHAAKGLEFESVILDLSAGWTLPDSCDEAHLEEERRILYVAISRAKDHLILIGRKTPKNKIGLEDQFFGYFHGFDARGKPTLRYRLLW